MPLRHFDGEIENGGDVTACDLGQVCENDLRNR